MLAALRQPDKTGQGQYVDISMYDAMVAFTDLIVHTTRWESSETTSGDAGADPHVVPRE